MVLLLFLMTDFICQFPFPSTFFSVSGFYHHWTCFRTKSSAYCCFGGSCLASWAPRLGEPIWLLHFKFLSFVTRVFVCHALFSSPLGVLGRLFSMIVALLGLSVFILFYLKLFVLRFYGPVNQMGSCRARSVYLTTRLLGRLSPLNG